MLARGGVKFMSHHIWPTGLWKCKKILLLFKINASELYLKKSSNLDNARIRVNTLRPYKRNWVDSGL